ncbi:Uncharacterised protein [uncultured archaeon]|nr:Uncharacterised protein [uncultured archaeon]
MKQITNKQIMEKLESIQNDIPNKEINKKIDTLLNTINNFQNNVADKETLRKLSNDHKKSSVIIYTGLSIAYLGIGLTLLLSSLKLLALQYSIIFGVFFGGSIILAYLGYIRKKKIKYIPVFASQRILNFHLYKYVWFLEIILATNVAKKYR